MSKLTKSVASQKNKSQYTLTNERLTVSRGIIRKHIDEIELYRITDSKAKQTFAQRLLGIGDLYVGSDDQTGNLLLKGVSKPKSKREQLRALVNKSRKESLRYRRTPDTIKIAILTGFVGISFAFE